MYGICILITKIKTIQFVIFKLKMAPLGPLEEYIDGGILGKYSKSYVLDNFADLNTLRCATKNLAISLPNCSIII